MEAKRSDKVPAPAVGLSGSPQRWAGVVRWGMLPLALVASYVAFALVGLVGDFVPAGYLFFFLPSVLVPAALFGLAWLSPLSPRVSVVVAALAYLALGLLGYLAIWAVATVPVLMAVFLWPTMVLWVFGCDLPLIGFCLN